MAKFIEVNNKPVKMDLFETIKFQLMVHCFVNKISLNETEYNCLALLGCKGEMRLVEFCRLASDLGFLGNPTAVNNCLARVEKSKLFIKKGAGKKMIFLNPDLNMQTKGNLLLNYKIVRIESDELQVGNKENSGATTTA